MQKNWHLNIEIYFITYLNIHVKDGGHMTRENRNSAAQLGWEFDTGPSINWINKYLWMQHNNSHCQINPVVYNHARGSSQRDQSWTVTEREKYDTSYTIAERKIKMKPEDFGSYRQ